MDQPLKFRRDGSVLPVAVRKTDRRGRPRLGEKRNEVGTNQLNVGADYTQEEVEFMMAMDRYKRQEDRPFPSWREVMEVFRGLGYRKVAATNERPAQTAQRMA